MSAVERDRDEFSDERYFESLDRVEQGFDARLLRKPARLLPLKRPVVLGPDDSVSDAMRAMQRERRHCVLITEDGTAGSRLSGLFTESDVLHRIVNRGRNPAELPLREVMTTDPETLSPESPISLVLNKMSVAGLQHLPVVDAQGRPACVASVDDVVTFLVETFPREILNLPAEEAPKFQRTREGA
jgi:CBS domain-containing protein